MSFSSSTRNHEVIHFANSCRLSGVIRNNPSKHTDSLGVAGTADAQAATAKENSNISNKLVLNPSLFVLSSSQTIPSEAAPSNISLMRHTTSLRSDVPTTHRERINTEPAMGTVAASQNADDPESPTFSQAKLSGRYAYSDHSKKHQGAFWRFFKLCFTSMSTWTAFRSGHVPARMMPHHGQTTPKNQYRVTANIPKQRCAAHRRSPSTFADPEPTVVPKGGDLGPRARRGFGFQGGRDDWSAICPVAQGCAA